MTLSHLVSVPLRPSPVVPLLSQQSNAAWHLENAQTKVTAKGTFYSSHHSEPPLPSWQCSAREYLPGIYLEFSQAVSKTEMRLVRSSGRRDAWLRNAPYWAGSVQVRRCETNKAQRWITWQVTLHWLLRGALSNAFWHDTCTTAKQLHGKSSHLYMCP